MDRISTLRNIEDALTRYEEDDLSLPELEREVRGVLRTYATDFQPEAAAYRARGDGSVDGLVVVATSRHEARENITDLLDDPGEFQVEPIE
ncbi:hypothetical protein SAMN05216226_103102 [Halovenus aranensis]|jgi:hypothetical protein|uniref:Uncharacterized protein n=1 Tax=Halovenus aranensis TaxID=890420 RepID=A0A1G8TJ86_9EURY|nr:hypothetical protein [Halovenus aranensis]SDJ41629.1 hypothetical protein SAMN05216226_103102 [Halovenus aranensis]